MTDKVSLRQIRYFLAAAKSGQFSIAATNENVSQSAITHAVLALEDAMGTRLFDRVPHGVVLTAEGADFFRHAQHIVDSVHDAIGKPRFHSKRLSGRVSIAASYTLLGYFLPELMTRFRASYPEVTLALMDMNRHEIESAVLAGDVELGIVILSNVSSPERFGYARLLRSRRQLWVAPDHPLARLPSPSLTDIASHPYLLLTADEGEKSTMQYWSSRQLQPDVGFRTASIECLRGLVANGFGVTILSDMLFRPWSLEGKRIEARPVLDVIPHMEAGMLWRQGVEIAEPAEAFRQFLLHAYGT